MKNRNLILSIFILSIFTQACVNSKSNTKKSNVDINSTSLENVEMSSNIIYQSDVKSQISSDLILNKTFYYITETDSGDIVIDWNDFGINGVRYTNDKLQYFGSGTKMAKIDSIIPKQEFIEVYMSYMFNNKKHTMSYEVEPVKEKSNYIRIKNINRILVDSIYSENIPIIKQARYDQ